jgi:hypothetical protein
LTYEPPELLSGVADCPDEASAGWPFGFIPGLSLGQAVRPNSTRLIATTSRIRILITLLVDLPDIASGRMIAPLGMLATTPSL